jgi:hypothetical protein
VSVGSEDRCAVNHSPGYVSGECAGEIRLYRATTSTAEFWLCEEDALTAPSRGVQVELVDETEEIS